jgi:hypothetical protein
MTKTREQVRERRWRVALYIVAALIGLRWLLIGAAQLPTSDFGEWAAAMLLFIVFILWARCQLPVGDHPLIRRDAGLLMVILAPIATLYYLFVTRRSRPRGISISVAASLVLPALAYAGGSILAATVPIPPRYVQLTVGGEWVVVDSASGTDIARRDLSTLADFVLRERAAGRAIPTDVLELYDRWLSTNPKTGRDPYDPFTGVGYYYEVRDSGFVLWSVGPDRVLGNDDDVWYAWPDPQDTSRATTR